MRDEGYEPEGKWDRRDKKLRKRRYGMRVSGASIKLLQKIIGRKGKNADRGRSG